MEITRLPDDEYCFNRIEVNGYYWIEMQWTIFKGMRVTCRKVNDDYLILNWCAGTNRDFALGLINKMIHAIEIGDVDILPLCSRVKPAHDDPAFLKMIERFNEKGIARMMCSF